MYVIMLCDLIDELVYSLYSNNGLFVRFHCERGAPPLPRINDLSSKLLYLMLITTRGVCCAQSRLRLYTTE